MKVSSRELGKDSNGSNVVLDLLRMVLHRLI